MCKGFICPSCYWGFLNAEDLQQHWEKAHQNGVSQDAETATKVQSSTYKHRVGDIQRGIQRLYLVVDT